MEINPDQQTVFAIGAVKVSYTIVCTWFVMAFIMLIAWMLGRKLTSGNNPTKFQCALETLYDFLDGQIKDIMQRDTAQFMPFLGTLFLFISCSAVLNTVPLYHPPTSSLSTTAALAVTVFFAVPFYGLKNNGLGGYAKHYFQPNPIMAPFHIISEFTRTLALALRLFGNTMSGTLVVAVLFLLTPLFVPLFMQMFEILIGVVQAYIFFVLSTVFIGASAGAHSE